MLKVENLVVRYGMIEAIKGISFEVNDGEIVTLIGANGAGKTTTMHTISGLLKPTEGSILLDGIDITKIPAHKIVTMGLAQIPERRRVFASQTVEENLDLGAFTRKDKEGIAQDLERVYTLFPRLKERKKQLAGTLSGGEQNFTALAGVLAMQPKVLLLDEPTNGLDVKNIAKLTALLRELQLPMLIASHDLRFSETLADSCLSLATDNNG